MKRHRVCGGSVACLLVAVLIFTGCGKKDDPMPPRVKLPVVNELTASSRPEGVALSWTIAVPKNMIGSFKILRSVTIRAEDACPGCPQDHRLFREVRIGEGKLLSDAAGSFRYVDGDVRKGSYYSYRIAACDRAGHCGEASNPSAVIPAER